MSKSIELSPFEQQFLIRIYRYPGCKLDYDACHDPSIADSPAVWKRLEELGLINCVGSYKWEPSEELIAAMPSAMASSVTAVVKNKSEHPAVPPIASDSIDYDKCQKCGIDPDSMIASCTSQGCPVWKNP